MGKRRSGSKWIVIRNITLVFLFGWLIWEGRFYMPKKVRPPEGGRPIEVEMKTTSYCHCRRCCSYRWFFFIPYQKTGFMQYRLKHVGMTSSGAMVRPGSIAADTSIYPYGTVMHIPGYGYGRVEDTGGAIKGQHIDLYRPNHWFARKWGVRTKKVKVWLPAEAQGWSFTPPEKARENEVEKEQEPGDGTISNRPPIDAVISNVLHAIQSVLTNEITADPEASATNQPESAVADEQIPLP